MSSAKPPRRRLLFVLPELKGGGAQRVTLALLGELDRERYDCSLLVLGGDGYELTPFIPSHVRALYPPRWLPGGLLAARLATAWFGRRHDLIIGGVEMRATFCAHFAAKLLRKPVIAWVHIAFEHWVAGFGRRHHSRSRAAYRDIEHVVFVAEGARASMARWLGYERSGWRVIPNLFSRDNYSRAAGRALPAETAALLERMRTRPAVVAIGRLEQRKGFDLLIAAAAEARRRGSDFDVVILGEGDERAALERQARELGLLGSGSGSGSGAGPGPCVFLPGYVPNPLPWLQAAQVFALSSRLEGLPTTIMEAMAAGTAVIATDCPSGPREMLAGGEAGVLVPMEDASAFAEGLHRLLSSPALREQYVARATQQLQSYSPAVVTAQWDQIIELACAAPRR